MKNKKIKKCDYGYLLYAYKSEIYITIALFTISLGILLFGIVAFGDKKNYFTIAAVLGLLPACRALINMIMFLKAKKFTCPANLHEEIVSVNSFGLNIRYDLYITSYDKVFPLQAMIVTDNTIIGYTVYDKFDDAKFSEHINTLLGQNLLKIGNIKIFRENEKDKFISRVAYASDNEKKATQNEAGVSHLMENISL